VIFIEKNGTQSWVRDAVRGGDIEIHGRSIHDPESIVFKRHSLGDPPLRGQIADIGIAA